MANYGAPPPGQYIALHQGAPAQGYQLQQPTLSPYQPGASGHGAPAQPHKGGGFANQLGQMMDQAVITGKPMFNKLGKTISSKLGSKPPGAPQHLQNYPNYQTHQGQPGQTQGHQQHDAQQQSQAFGSGPQQQQWPPQQGQQAPQQQQASNAYVTPQQSPFPHSSYATPASGHSGQSNYFPHQQGQAPPSHPGTPVQQQPATTLAFHTSHFEQSGLTMEQYMQKQQVQQAQNGQHGQNQNQVDAAPPPPYQHQDHTQSTYPGQQTGVVGGLQSPAPLQNLTSPNMQPVQPPTSPPGLQSPPGGMQPPQLYQIGPQSPIPHDHSQQQQQWTPGTPLTLQSQGQLPVQGGYGQPYPNPTSPPPLEQSYSAPVVPQNKAPQSAQAPSPLLQRAASQQVASTEFIAELPADMASLTLMESHPKKSGSPVTQGVKGQGQQPGPPGSNAPYKAYTPQGQAGSPPPGFGFNLPRRPVSSNSIPLADPWRFADPITELPTREFYIIADLLFDALDRKQEPRNTGLLEAPKISSGWLTLPEETGKIFAYNSYSTFGKMWSLQGVPHMLVPTQPWLMPNWNFGVHAHKQELTLGPEAPAVYASYMPALNRAGWYKFFFLEVSPDPDQIGEKLERLCSDTYKPGVLHHPDLNKRDRGDIPGLRARAARLHSHSIQRVIEETKLDMALDPDVVDAPAALAPLRLPGA